MLTVGIKEAQTLVMPSTKYALLLHTKQSILHTYVVRSTYYVPGSVIIAAAGAFELGREPPTSTPAQKEEIRCITWHRLAQASVIAILVNWHPTESTLIVSCPRCCPGQSTVRTVSTVVVVCLSVKC